jgi:hypothetical protein
MCIAFAKEGTRTAPAVVEKEVGVSKITKTKHY